MLAKHRAIFTTGHIKRGSTEESEVLHCRHTRSWRMQTKRMQPIIDQAIANKIEQLQACYSS